MHTCALKYSDGRSQAREKEVGEGDKMCPSLKRAWEMGAPPQHWSAPFWRVDMAGAKRERQMHAGPTETALMLLRHLAQGQRHLGEMWPRAPQCSCLLFPENTTCLWGGGGVLEDGFLVRASFRLHHIHLLACEALGKQLPEPLSLSFLICTMRATTACLVGL